MPNSHHLEIIPLGGLGEFGMNLMLYRHGKDCVVIDAGMMFPGAEHLGVDVVIPDLSFLDDCGTIHGVVLTHGHEDHIGAVPYLLSRLDVPIYAPPHARELIRLRLTEHDQVHRLAPTALPPDGDSLRLGPFTVETLPVSHSVPQAKMIILRTPVGTVLHTADFKLAPAPGRLGTDLGRLAQLGREGVLALLSDSTNADRPGMTPGEGRVESALDGLLCTAKSRVLITAFSSNVERIERIAALAARHGRQLALVGTSVQTQVEVCQNLGLIQIAPEARVSPDRVMDLPPRRALIVVTGSQGEPMSALSRIALDRHRDVSIGEGDLVIHSARVIPGNETSIGRMINRLLRRGADVITADDAAVHVSGHPSSDELRLLLSLVRPRFLIPIHGEYRQLRTHARLAVDHGLDPANVVLASSGDVVALDEHGISIEGKVHVGQVFIDATLDKVDWSILQDRRRIAADGIVIPVVSVDRESGATSGFPEIITRGFVPEGDASGNGVLGEAKQVIVDCLADAGPDERSDEALLKARIHSELKRFLRRRTQRRPIIIPIILGL